MALKPKNSLLQIRLDSDSLQLFQARCDHYGETASQALRHAIKRMNEHYLKSVSKLEVGEVLPEVEKSPVEPLRQPQSLSDRRKAEKLAKQAKMAKRENRYLDD